VWGNNTKVQFTGVVFSRKVASVKENLIPIYSPGIHAFCQKSQGQDVIVERRLAGGVRNRFSESFFLQYSFYTFVQLYNITDENR